MASDFSSTLLQKAFIEGTGGDRNDPPQRYPIRLWQMGQPLTTPPTETIVVIHGRQSEALDESEPLEQVFPRLYGLAAELAQSPSAQILLVDAREALTDPDLPPYRAAGRIRAIAHWTAAVLQGVPNLTVIGHSLGAHVAAEASAQLKASRLIALDPAYPAKNYDVDGLVPDRQSVRDVAASAPHSLAFVVVDGPFQLGLAGDNDHAGTAHTSLVTQFDGLSTIFDANEAHGAVIDLFADLSRYVSPNTAVFDSLFESLVRDRYDNFGDRSGGLHEGVAYADRDDSKQWRLEWIDGDGQNVYFVSDALPDVPELDDDNGLDTIVTLKSFTLEDDVERLILGGGANLEGTGNTVDNHIWGNQGDNLLIGKGGNDVILADSGKDEIHGKSGADVLSGHADADVLIGDNGNDILRGGDQDDVLWGDRGHDELVGGSGSDIFVLQNEQGVDTIQDFDVLVDRLGLSSGIRFLDLSFTQLATGTQISTNEDVLARVDNVSSAEFTRSHFVVV
ncbi:MAG: hypothetical protein VKL39_05220 [Leptolyngbyaceae bacterium]|nr:hypothetical protein [Leptolyngbyaceae bacterium]